MVVYDVDQYLHPVFMNRVAQEYEIFQRPEFRIDRPVVLDRIRRTQRSLALDRADRMDRKKPDQIYAKLSEPGKIFRDFPEAASEIPDEDTVQRTVGQFHHGSFQEM